MQELPDDTVGTPGLTGHAPVENITIARLALANPNTVDITQRAQRWADSGQAWLLFDKAVVVELNG
jgi:hypothetical protein